MDTTPTSRWIGWFQHQGERRWQALTEGQTESEAFRRLLAATKNAGSGSLICRPRHVHPSKRLVHRS